MVCESYISIIFHTATRQNWHKFIVFHQFDRNTVEFIETIYGIY